MKTKFLKIEFFYCNVFQIEGDHMTIDVILKLELPVQGKKFSLDLRFVFVNPNDGNAHLVLR